MLPAPKPARKRSARQPFLSPPGEDGHPALRRIEADRPADHHARVGAHLDRSVFRLSYAGYDSLASPVELLRAFVLFLDSKGVLSPAAWARRGRHDDPCQWLLRGLVPSRSPLYTFRDRVEPYRDGWHPQRLAWAIAEQITPARLGSLDGTFVAALASRHQRLNSRRPDRRLLLHLLIWRDGGPGLADLSQRLDGLPELTGAAPCFGWGCCTRACRRRACGTRC